MIRRLQRSTRTDTRFPESTLFRSAPRHILFRATPHIEEHDMTQKPGGNAPLPPSAAPSPRPPLQSLPLPRSRGSRSEEHTCELQSLMRISNDVICSNKNKPTH